MSFSAPIHKLTILLMIALAANLDNFGIGTAYGIAKRQISRGSNFIIALLAIGLTYAVMTFGRVLVLIMPSWVANLIGALVIVLVGIWIYWEAPLTRLLQRYYNRLLRRWRSPTEHSAKKLSPGIPPALQSPPFEQLQRVNLRETFVLGVSLALNAMAGGLGASLSGHNPVTTSLAVGVFSYITIDLGQAISGTYLSKRLGVLAPKAAGLLLVVIGIYELFD
jgi:putative sporulation protein YtaF